MCADDADFGRVLTYFNRSRREFIKLGGLAAAGLVFSGSLGFLSGAQVLPQALGADYALAQGLKDADVRVVTNVPATKATSVFDAFHALMQTPPVYSFNEETAYTIAHGAALAGARSAAIIKSHGLAKAANSVIDSLTIGVTAGFVTLALDDPDGEHSDNVFGLADFLRGTGIPFKKAKGDTLYSDVLECLYWSEKMAVPVVLLIDSRLLDQKSDVVGKRLEPPQKKYRRDVFRHVLCPPLAPYQRKVLDAKLAGRDWQSIPEPVMPPVPQGLLPVWREAASQFVPVFDVFRELRPEIPFVCGDTGLSSLFAFAPFGCVDACSYYGGSLPLAIGAHLGGLREAWAVTGDYSFLAAGHMGLPEALTRLVPLKVMIMDNGRAAATGGQPVFEGLMDHMLKGWLPFVSRIDHPDDRVEVRTVLNRVRSSKRMEIVHVRFRS